MPEVTTSDYGEATHARFTPEAVFRALADATRLRCLLLIATNHELCVCELVHALDLSQPKISRHLKLLRDSGLVADRREKIWVYYRIAPELPDWVATVIQVTVESNARKAPFAADARRLSAMPDRPGDRCPEYHPTESS